jgi:hypothetical protein
MKFTKTQWEDLFVQACWISSVWNPGNKRAERVRRQAQLHLDPRWCVRASNQISDLDLRYRWLEAKRNGTPLPRVTSAVRRHLEREFEQSFPNGVTDPEIDNP